MRVLVSAVPSVGHIVPLLDLATAFRDAGHEVRFATHSGRHRLLADAGLPPVSAGMSSEQMVAERLRRWPETAGQPATVWATRMWTQIMAPATLADLHAIIADWRPHLVVHDEGDYAAPVAAAAVGLPCITHAWGSPLRPASELVELEELLAGLWGSCGMEVPAAAGLYGHGLVNPCPPLLQPGPPGASAVVWPLRPRTLAGQGVAVEGDAYVGFGTVPTFADAPLELEAAVRACVSRGLRVVATAPTPALREALISIDRRLVVAEEFVSLPDLLPSCKVVISHAGAGTVLASLAAGVPVVLVPRGSPSQMRMADACQQAGVGRSCDAWSVEAALDEVLEQPTVRVAASAAAGQIATMPPAAEIVRQLEPRANRRRSSTSTAQSATSARNPDLR